MPALWLKAGRLCGFVRTAACRRQSMTGLCLPGYRREPLKDQEWPMKRPKQQGWISRCNAIRTRSKAVPALYGAPAKWQAPRSWIKPGRNIPFYIKGKGR